MWIYTKQLEYPVNITNPDPRMAKLLMALYGGPDSELASGLRYLTQRFTMPDDRCRATLNDIGTEELAHWEMLGTMIYQCMRGASYAQTRRFPRRPQRRAFHNGIHRLHRRPGSGFA